RFLLIFSRFSPPDRTQLPSIILLHVASVGMSSISERKAELRARFLAYRASISESDYLELSHRIIATAQRLPDMGPVSVGRAYWPIRGRRGVDTRPLIRWRDSRGKTSLLPRIVSLREQRGEQRARARLSHITHPGEQGLLLNRWGIAEPPPG